MKYRRPSLKSNYDAIVIGAGMGGLTAATFLAKNGYTVLVVERHYLPGGYAQSFRRKGFLFDAAVHHIGGGGRLSLVGQALRELNINLEMIRLDPMDTITFPGYQIDIPAELDDYIALLQSRYPMLAGQITGFFKELIKLYRAVIRDDPASPILQQYEHATFGHMLDKFFDNEHDPACDEIKNILGAQSGYIGPSSARISALSMAQMLVTYLKDGAWFPLGGTQRFVDAFVLKLYELGSDVLLYREVTQIKTRNGVATGILLADGNEISADLIISNADVKTTFERLIQDANLAGYRDSIESMEESTPLCTAYLGLSAEIDLSPIKRGFYHCSNDPDSDDHEWFYVSVPTRTDPTMAPDGKQILTMDISLPLSNDRWRSTAQSDDPEAYQKFRAWLKAHVFEFLRQYAPEIESHLEICELGTPKTMIRYTLNSNGVPYGWATVAEQSWRHRLDHTTPIENLYLAGHWTQPGPGVPAVISSGWRVANMILRSRGTRIANSSLVRTN